MNSLATSYGGRPRPRPPCVKSGPGSPPAQQLPNFGLYLFWPNGRPSQQLLSCCCAVRANRQTNRHADTLIAIFGTPTGGKVTISLSVKKRVVMELLSGTHYPVTRVFRAGLATSAITCKLTSAVRTCPVSTMAFFYDADQLSSFSTKLSAKAIVVTL